MTSGGHKVDVGQTQREEVYNNLLDFTIKHSFMSSWLDQ